jgi:4-hydroxy-2-oxoheptanedioate aldolase
VTNDDPQRDFPARVRRGDLVIGTFANLGSPVSAEICGAAGFDWVLIDLEHGAGDEARMLGQLQALGSTGAAGLVRVESNDRVRVTSALDAGAHGVMIPRVETASAAGDAARHVRYPPDGDRGVALMNRGTRFGSRRTEEMAAGRPLVIAQIETSDALDELDDIAGTAGVDVLFLGPSDLTWALGIPGQTADPRYLAAVDKVSAAAAAAGKAAGVLVGSPDQVLLYEDRGYTVIGVSGEIAFLSGAARDALARARRAGETARG